VISRRATKRFLGVSALSALMGLMGTGYDVVPPELEGEWLRLQRAFIRWATGPTSPSDEPSPTPAASHSPVAGVPDLSTASRGRGAKANAELLREMHQVIFIQEPKDRSAFGSLVDSMNQGASLEGIYNGLVHSDEYRRLEASGISASPEALRAFGEELAALESELAAPVEFDAQGIARPPSEVDGVKVIEYGKPSPSPRADGAPSARPSMSVAARAALAEKYSRQFVGAPVYVLKRVIADEALRVVASKRDYPEKLALWYSRWVAHMSARKVDFGISQRNQADEAFHYKWALTAGEDRIAWEVLNRLHRVLNALNGARR
jgi:hypothetical protein